MSIIFAKAAELHREMTDAYEEAVGAQYSMALEHTNGYLLNKRGKVKEVASEDLFKGSETRAYLYASEELVSFWVEYPRLSKAKYERTWASALGVN